MLEIIKWPHILEQNQLKWNYYDLKNYPTNVKCKHSHDMHQTENVDNSIFHIIGPQNIFPHTNLIEIQNSYFLTCHNLHISVKIFLTKCMCISNQLQN